MNTEEQIKAYINSQAGAKSSDMQTLHNTMLQIMPGCKLWFLDGKDAQGKTVTNPNIGYGSYLMKYADGSNKEFYQVGMSANTSGISVYIMGIPDKNHLANAYGEKIGKAKVTGYCIRFKSLNDINLNVLEAAIRDGVQQTKSNIHN